MHGGQVSERLFELGLCLPSGAGMSEEDRNRVIAGVLKCFS
jgi:dTDP-4-amino-4,6-dideoxygalactose transaminase